jgi:hypothetical protein
MKFVTTKIQASAVQLLVTLALLIGLSAAQAAEL